MKLVVVGLGGVLILTAATAGARAPGAAAAASREPAPAAAAPAADSSGSNTTTAPPPEGPAPDAAPVPNSPAAAPSAGKTAEGAPAPAASESAAPQTEAEPPSKAEPPAKAEPHVVWVDTPDEAPLASTEPEAPPPEPEEKWQLAGRHFVVSIDRASGVLGWSSKSEATVDDGFGHSHTVSAETSGVDIGLLGSGGASRTVFGVPRLAFDGITSGGLTVGGSISYMLTTGGTGTAIAGQPISQSRDLPEGSVFLFAPRVGVWLAVSPNAAVWLRGGITRASVAVSGKVNVGGSDEDVSTTLSLWDATFEPQFALVAASHVALVVGGVLDVGLGGSFTEDIGGESSDPIDVTSSAYGGTVGLAGVF